jgi:hypothetical protein
MKFAITAAVLALNLSVVSALYVPHVARGTQFITGPCASDSDCAAGCCGFNTGKCAGAIIALERDGGCGFGNEFSNDNAARALGFTGQFTPKSKNGGAAPGGAAPPAAAPGGSGKAPGTQFITGPCGSDADCAAGCCGFNTGKCAGAIIALERDGGCGFGNEFSNDNAARALGFTGQFTPKSKNGGAAPAPAPAPAAGGGGGETVTVQPGDTCTLIASIKGTTAAAIIAANPGINAGCTNLQVGQVLNVGGGGGGAAAPPPAAKTGGSGKPPGTQFITGECGSDGDCASGCCAFRTGKCAGAIIALTRDGGCGRGDAVSNDRAARQLGFTGPFTPVSA